MNVPSFGAVARGKIAVVTGAAGGIGLAAARAFGDAGMQVVLVDRAGAALQDAAASIPARPPCQPTSPIAPQWSSWRKRYWNRMARFRC